MIGAATAETARRRAAWWFVSPAIVSLSVFFVLPLVAGFVLSLTDFDLYALADLRHLRFIGLRNYADLLSSPRFWQAAFNTLYFAVIAGPLSIAVSLGAALLLDAQAGERVRTLLRTVLFLPVVTTLVAVAVVWRSLYHPRYGLLNTLLAWCGAGPIDWLGDPVAAMPSLILMAIWKNFGFNMVIFVAALQAVPRHLYEAAALDGAGPWQQFRHVTLPALRPTLVFTAIVTAIGYLQLFAEPYVMTQGGPAGATRSLVLLTYEEGFRFWNLGRAAAAAFLLFAMVSAASAAIGAAQRRGGAGAAR